MMADAPTSDSVQARAIFLFENERYSPLSGWSAKGLLPTDRKAFTTEDNMHGFNTIPEATEAFACLGWEWVPEMDWKVDMNLENVDLEGWTYSADFGSLKDETCGHRVMGAMHFVRRRRWVRYQSFDARNLAPGAVLTCSYCDLEEVERLAGLLLERLSQASANKHPHKNSDLNTVHMKNAMLTTLNVAHPDTENYSFESIDAKLTHFVHQAKNLLSSTSSLLSGESPTDTLRKRTAFIAATHFTTDEANETARLIIRVLDRSNTYHCDQPHCGEDCEFALQECRNAGCGKVFSRKWATKHDAVCPHKLLACERECGENVKRAHMREHLQLSCELRTVRCPCYDLGCKTEILARELKGHCEAHQVDHLMQIVDRLKEVQHVVAEHDHQLTALNTRCDEHTAALATATAGIAGALATAKAIEARQEHKLHDSVKALENRISKEASANASNRSEISALRTQLAAVAKR